jgi:23S rRNA maturation-related 3'-5' exoribonuclease YhaM
MTKFINKNHILARCLFYLFLIPLFSTCTLATIKSEKKELTSRIPPKVKEAFRASHGEIEATFYKIKKGATETFEIEYTQSQKHHSVSYSLDGELLETEVEISPSDIPSTVREKIFSDLNQRYKNYKLYELQTIKIEKNTHYEIKIYTSKSETGLLEVLYANTGQWIEETSLRVESIHTLN